MSYCYATPQTVSKTARMSKDMLATRLTNGLRFKAFIDKHDGDDEDGQTLRTVTIANLRKSKNGKYINFNIEELNTDEPCELLATDFLRLA